MSERESTVEHVIKQIEDISSAIYRFVTPEMVTRDLINMDLTMLQLKTGLLLYNRGPMRMSDIAATLGASTATATGVVDRMVEREYIIRQHDPSDRRVVICQLTDTGKRLVSSMWQMQQDRRRELLSQLSEEHLKIFEDALESMVLVMQELKAETANKAIKDK